jgi:glycosyltransferase involved in cell wall biosynthesis
MKILLIEPFGHENGHYSIYAGYMCRAMAEAGNEVTLISFAGLLNDVPNDIKVKHVLAIHETSFYTLTKRVTYKIIKNIFPLRPFSSFFQTSLVLDMAIKMNKNKNYDVIHLLDTSLHSLPLNIAGSKTSGQKLVLTLHGPPRKDEQNSLNQALINAIRQKLFVNAFTILASRFSNNRLMDICDKKLYELSKKKNAMGFVCYTEELRARYAKIGFYDEVTFITDTRPRPTAISQLEARKLLGLPFDKTILLSFGINHDRKDYELIFKAASSIAKTYKLVFAGKVFPEMKDTDPHHLASIYDLVQDTIIDDRQIPDNEMLSYFFAADALLVSYKKGFDQLSGSLLQACQCGLPVIGIDEGHIGGFIRINRLGLTFKAGELESLKQAIVTFLNMSEIERSALRRNVLKYADLSKNWEKMTNGYLELYKSLSRDNEE